MNITSVKVVAATLATTGAAFGGIMTYADPSAMRVPVSEHLLAIGISGALTGGAAIGGSVIGDLLHNNNSLLGAKMGAAVVGGFLGGLIVGSHAVSAVLELRR